VSVQKQKALSASEIDVILKENERLKNVERVLLGRLDRKEGIIDWAFRHPVKFMLGRIYHQQIKRDQKNVKN